MGKLEKYFTIFACGFFTASVFMGLHLNCLPMYMLSGLFAIMTGFAAIADGGNSNA